MTPAKRIIVEKEKNLVQEKILVKYAKISFFSQDKFLHY